MDKKEPQSINVRELARKINKRSHRRIKVSDAEKAINLALEISSELLQEGETIKLGKYAKVYMEDKPSHVAYNGISKTHFTVPDKKVVKLKKLSKIVDIENNNNDND